MEGSVDGSVGNARRLASSFLGFGPGLRIQFDAVEQKHGRSVPPLAAVGVLSAPGVPSSATPVQFPSRAPI